MDSEIKNEIFALLAKDDIEQAIDKMIYFYDGTILYKEVIVNAATLERIKRAYKKDIISWELMSRKKNQIIIDLAAIINEPKLDQVKRRAKPSASAVN